MTIKDTIQMFSVCGVDPQDLPIKSLKSLHRIHDRLSVSRKWIEEGFDEIFPDPPFPGTENIQPIRTLSELLEESTEQHNCCASYAKYIHKKDYYLYRARRPVRVTIAIVHKKYADDSWKIEQIYRAANQPIHQEDFDQLRAELLNSRTRQKKEPDYPPEWDNVAVFTGGWFGVEINLFFFQVTGFPEQKNRPRFLRRLVDQSCSNDYSAPPKLQLTKTMPLAKSPGNSVNQALSSIIFTRPICSPLWAVFV